MACETVTLYSGIATTLEYVCYSCFLHTGSGPYLSDGNGAAPPDIHGDWSHCCCRWWTPGPYLSDGNGAALPDIHRPLHVNWSQCCCLWRTVLGTRVTPRGDSTGDQGVKHQLTPPRRQLAPTSLHPLPLPPLILPTPVFYVMAQQALISAWSPEADERTMTVLESMSRAILCTLRQLRMFRGFVVMALVLFLFLVGFFSNI